MIAVTVPIVTAARSLDEQDRDIAILARRRVEDRARNHVVAPRFKHQAGADPVMALKKMLPPGERGRTLEYRQVSTRDDRHRIAACAVLMQKNVDAAMT